MADRCATAREAGGGSPPPALHHHREEVSDANGAHVAGRPGDIIGSAADDLECVDEHIG